LVISHNDLQKTDCVELASSLTQGGVSGVVLAHALLKTSVPKEPIQQRLFGGTVSVGQEVWLDDAVCASAHRKKIKLGRVTAKPLPTNSIAVCFQKQGAQKAIVSVEVVSRTSATLYFGFVITRRRRRGGGKRERGRVVRKVRHNSHSVSHGEIVLVTNDDDILGYKA
jgi:hypothetical protein